MSNIENASQLSKSDLVNINYFDEHVKKNCVVIDVIQDEYFKKGLIVYLNGLKIELLDLENNMFKIQKIY